MSRLIHHFKNPYCVCEYIIFLKVNCLLNSIIMKLSVNRVKDRFDC